VWVSVSATYLDKLFKTLFDLNHQFNLKDITNTPRTRHGSQYS
jgi:hypothetical protein